MQTRALAKFPGSHPRRGLSAARRDARAEVETEVEAEVAETVLLYEGQRGRPRARRMLTEMDSDQKRLYDLFGLNAYAPSR